MLHIIKQIKFTFMSSIINNANNGENFALKSFDEDKNNLLDKNELQNVINSLKSDNDKIRDKIYEYKNKLSKNKLSKNKGYNYENFEKYIEEKFEISMEDIINKNNKEKQNIFSRTIDSLSNILPKSEIVGEYKGLKFNLERHGKKYTLELDESKGIGKIDLKHTFKKNGRPSIQNINKEMNIIKNKYDKLTVEDKKGYPEKGIDTIGRGGKFVKEVTGDALNKVLEGISFSFKTVTEIPENLIDLVKPDKVGKITKILNKTRYDKNTSEDDIKILQHTLNKLGANLKVDGKWGKNTRKKLLSTRDDWKNSTKDYKTMEKNTEDLKKNFTKIVEKFDIKKYSKNVPAIKTLQKALIGLNYKLNGKHDGVDGSFGGSTKKAYEDAKIKYLTLNEF